MRSKQLWITTCPLEDTDINCSPIVSKQWVEDDWPVNKQRTPYMISCTWDHGYTVLISRRMEAENKTLWICTRRWNHTDKKVFGDQHIQTAVGSLPHPIQLWDHTHLWYGQVACQWRVSRAEWSLVPRLSPGYHDVWREAGTGSHSMWWSGGRAALGHVTYSANPLMGNDNASHVLVSILCNVNS